MTDAINGASAPAPYLNGAPSTSVDRPDQMGKDTFLKLLVAQLRYQDPANPASSTEFLAQTASFTQVEKLEALLTASTEMAVSQRALSAGAMVGQNVSYVDESGETQTGTVASVRFDSGETFLMIDDVPVPMGRVTEIAARDQAPPGTDDT